MKSIYSDLRNSRVQNETIMQIRNVIRGLKNTGAKVTPTQLQLLIQNTVYNTGSRADVLYITPDKELVVKKDDISYSWDVSSLVIP